VFLEKAFQHLLEHHDALRLRYVSAEEGWRQTGTRGEHPPVLRSLEGADVEAAAAELQSSFDLARGPLLRAALITRGPGVSGRLLIAIHHLVVDGVSWRVLLEDLGALYRQLRQGEPPSLPPKTTSFKTWAERLNAYAGSEELLRELPHWL